jgi:hypothetical protein
MSLPNGRWPIIHSFDIFKIQPSGQVRWQGTQESFLTAKRHIQKIMLSSPGQYIILNQITGDKVVLGQACVPTQLASSGVESGDAARNGMD